MRYHVKVVRVQESRAAVSGGVDGLAVPITVGERAKRI
jgi:hypothetical protein